MTTAPAGLADRAESETAKQSTHWRLCPVDTEQAAALERELRCPAPIARLLTSRGIGIEQARQFFHPSIDDLFEPMLLLGMPAAVRRIQKAVAAGEPILIYGDYDVDGTTATALLKIAIERIAPKDLPAKVTYHVPHRILEGYGMQVNVLGEAALNGIRLVISVDTGIRAFAAAAEAKALGLDLIVTDHHLPDEAEGIPEALAVINPAQANCPYPFKSLCGAAVAFKLAHALLSAAAETDADHQRLKEKILPSFLKLVALATVADSVPLVGENRIIAALGLAALKDPVQPGLRALMQVAKIPIGTVPTATQVGFRLGPRINAAGRMDIAAEVVELFLTRDPERALFLAQKLDALNQDRRNTEAQALAAIEAQLEAILDGATAFPAECLILDDPAWHRGVLGILASRVVERTGRPALILTHEDGQAHGSGRSIEGFHLLDALTAVHKPDSDELGTIEVFSRFGGHAHAVGFSLPTANLDLLRSRMRGHAAPLLTAPLLEPRLDCDVALTLDEITPDLYDWLNRCAPFGVANPEPIFVTERATLRSAPRFIKEVHLCLEIEIPNRPGASISALAWNRAGRGPDWIALSNSLNLASGSKIDLAYRIRQSTFGRTPTLELELCDLRLSGPQSHIQ